MLGLLRGIIKELMPPRKSAKKPPEKSSEAPEPESARLKKRLAELEADFERRLREKTREAEEARARLAASIYGLSIGFLMVDNDRNIVLTNPAAGKILGFHDPQSLVAGTENVLDRVTEFEKILAGILTEEKPFEPRELVFGSRFLKLFPSPIILIGIEASKAQTKGESIGAVVLVEDITEAKKLEMAKDEFLAISSHEMRTPLTIIRGNSELLLEGFMEGNSEISEVNKRVERIHSNSVRMLNIVNDFLDLMRLESGRIELKSEPFDVVPAVEEVIADLQGKAAKKRLTLKLAPPPPLPEVFADRSRAQQVLVNVIGNAIQYTESGGINVSFLAEGKEVKIFIADTGIGIEPGLQDTLFQKFQTIGKQFIHSKEYGSGLGLYISRLITDAMGGRIWLEESAPGKGSVFGIALPSSITATTSGQKIET